MQIKFKFLFNTDKAKNKTKNLFTKNKSHFYYFTVIVKLLCSYVLVVWVLSQFPCYVRGVWVLSSFHMQQTLIIVNKITHNKHWLGLLIPYLLSLEIIVYEIPSHFTLTFQVAHSLFCSLPSDVIGASTRHPWIWITSAIIQSGYVLESKLICVISTDTLTFYWNESIVVNTFELKATLAACVDLIEWVGHNSIPFEWNVSNVVWKFEFSPWLHMSSSIYISSVVSILIL